MFKKLGSKLYLISDKVSTLVSIFRFVKEVTIFLWIYLILWLLEVLRYLTWLHVTSSDRTITVIIVTKLLQTEVYQSYRRMGS